MKARLAKLARRAGAVSQRTLMTLAASSLIATSTVIAGALTGSGFPLAAALAALRAQPAAVATDALDPSLSSSLDSLGPATDAPAPAPQPGPATQRTAPPPADETTPTTPDETTPTPPPAEPSGPFGHVFVISLTSPGYEAAFGEQSRMPYLATELRPQGTLLSGYSLLSHASLPNLIAATSGQEPNASTKENCPVYEEFPPAKGDEELVDDKGYVHGDGCIYPVHALSVADQVAGLGKSWRGYMEGMADADGPGNCVRPGANEKDETIASSNGEYSVTHNPFPYYHSLLDLGACTSSDVPIDSLKSDLSSETTTPAFSFIAPNRCHSGTDGACGEGVDAAAAADDYLKSLVPKILGSKAFEDDGLLIVTFGDAAAAVEPGDPVGALVVSGLTSPGGELTDEYDPYSLLRTVEDLFGVSPLARAAKADSFATAIVNGGD